MARGPRYRVLFRRRRSGRTNFHYRKSLILSNQSRFTVRPSLKHVKVQVISAELIGDKSFITFEDGPFIPKTREIEGAHYVSPLFLPDKSLDERRIAPRKSLEEKLLYSFIDIKNEKASSRKGPAKIATLNLITFLRYCHY